MGRYVPISEDEFTRAMDAIGFRKENQPGFWEMSWVRDVVTKSGREFPYLIRVDSTIDLRTGMSRETGEDAIRLTVIDKVTKRPASGDDFRERAFRTLNALSNTTDKARALFKAVVAGPHCPKCGSLMVQRCSKAPGAVPFWGCTHYAPKNEWHCTGTMPVGENDRPTAKN